MTKQELIIEKQNEIIALENSSQYLEVVNAIKRKKLELNQLMLEDDEDDINKINKFYFV